MSHSKRKRFERRNEKKRQPKGQGEPLQRTTSMGSEREVLQLGPITIERIGRLIYMRSNWDPEEHRRYMQQVKQARPRFKRDIDDKIQRLSNLVKEYNSLVLLTAMSLTNLFADPENYRETTHTGSEAKVELLMSIATAFPYPSNPKVSTLKVQQEVSGLLDEILNDAFSYYGSEIAETGDRGVESELRQMLLGFALKVRGPAYWPHLKQTFLEVYIPHDEFLAREFGFTARQFLDTLEYAEQAVMKRVRETMGSAQKKLERSHSKFVDWSEGKETEFSSIEELMCAFLSAHPEVVEDMEEFRETLETSGGQDMFKVTPRNEADTRILEAIACTFGDNLDFFEKLPRWSGWPLNPSLIYEKPVICHAGSFYLFHSPLALRSVGYLLERLIESIDSQYFDLQFLTARDEYLELKSLELLGNLLPRSDIYPKLHYPIVVGGKEQWVETDGLIAFGNILIIVEAKAGKLSARARRGSILRLKDNLKDILGKAHEQGMRTLKYIKSTAEAPFYDARRNPVVCLKANQFADIFVVTVSYEQLGFLAAQLTSIEKMGVIKGQEWPWAVYLNDLRVISEILEHPTQFIHYLKRRILVNDFDNFKFADELAILMFYLKEGLYFDGAKLNDKTQVSPLGYAEDLDSYYLFREGVRTEVPKPRQEIPELFEQLITVLERSRPPAFVEAAIVLLDCSKQTRAQIAEQILRMEKEFSQDDRPHTASLVFSTEESAILLACLHSDDERRITNWAGSYLRRGFKKVLAISWQYPLKDGNITVRRFVAT